MLNQGVDIVSRLLDKMTIQDVVKRWTDSVPFHNCIGWMCFILFGGPYYETPMGEMFRTSWPFLLTMSMRTWSTSSVGLIFRFWV